MIDKRNLPLLSQDLSAPSVFTPASLLREARRQKSIPEGAIPKICILDPDGDIVQNLIEEGRASLSPFWACYHTQMYDFAHKGVSFGIVGNVVGASFAVLVAEEMFASGCELLLSMTSAGQILAQGQPPYFVLIERAVRDEGTSYHYLPPSRFSTIRPELQDCLKRMLDHSLQPIFPGATWTTDAPFRETRSAIDSYRSEGIFGVEMEAAALYAFAAARSRPVICFAHITNQMGMVDNDFEKGAAQGSLDALEVLAGAAEAWLACNK